MTHSGRRLGTSIFKGSQDYARSDTVCTGLRAVSGACELASGIIGWVPMPVGKICILSSLKAASYACMIIRNLCAAEPDNPIC